MNWLRSRNWPLRTKVALASALVAGLTIAVAMSGVYIFVRTELRDILEQRLDREMREVATALEHHMEVRPNIELTGDVIPRQFATRLAEVFDPGGRLLYRSPSLQGETLAGLAPVAGASSEQLMQGRSFLIAQMDGGKFRIFFGVPMGNFHQTLKRLAWAGIIAMPSVILLSLAGGIWVARRALSPVQGIITVAKSISAEEFEKRVPLPPTRDEVAELAGVLNETFDRLEHAYQLAIRFSADASHQLKTPVTVMRMTIEDLMRNKDLTKEHLTSLNDLLHQTRRLASLAEGLLLLARADAGAIEINLMETDIRCVVEGCAEDGEVLAERRGITIQFEAPNTLLAVADPPRVEQVLLNLIENAVKYNYDGGIVFIRAFRYGKWARIVVSNNSTNPIPADKQPYVFDRFSRGDGNEDVAGHGLGLAIARELAVAMGGDLTLLRSDAEWTEFEFILPAVRGAGPLQKKRTMPLNFLAPPPRRG